MKNQADLISLGNPWMKNGNWLMSCWKNGRQIYIMEPGDSKSLRAMVMMKPGDTKSLTAIVSYPQFSGPYHFEEQQKIWISILLGPLLYNSND